MTNASETLGSSGKNNHVDFDDPLYVYLSDNIVATIVSIKLTGNEIFWLWRSPMIRGLKERNKVGFVDSTLKKSIVSYNQTFKWERANVVVGSWILGTISEFIYVGNDCSEVVEDIWNELFET